MSKELIRKQVGEFLGNIPKNNPIFRPDGQKQFYTTAVDIGVDVEAITEHLSLTGAGPAILPMQISTIGYNNDNTIKRNTFTMLINPETWNHSKNNSTQAIYARNGWVITPWGPNQDTISSTGRTAAFMLPAFGMSNIGSEMSFGYLNFLALLSTYKNNGYEYADFTAGDLEPNSLPTTRSFTRVINKIRGVQISYDNNIYMGHFNNFTLDEDESFPFLYNYNFEFIISTLDGAETEVRGHYQKLPESEIDLQKGTERDPRVSKMVNDPVVKPLSNPSPLNAMDDSVVRRLWEQKTGLSWNDPARIKYSNGSFDQNINLRKLLLSKTWNKDTKSFN